MVRPPPTMQPALLASTTLGEAVGLLQQQFAAAGIHEAGRDARILAERILRLEPGAHIRRPGEAIGAGAPELEAAARRRLSREPISRITGERAFWGRDFLISPATLDPRPDTETIVEAALGLVSDGPAGAAPTILDIGTGSGCILISLLAELPGATGTGTDISPEALEVAAANANRHGVGERSRWVQIRSAPPAGETFDLVVSNPPYIPSSVIAGLEPEVRLFDPPTALDGGGDGLEIYREILSGLGPDVLRGWALCEVGHDQAASLCELVLARYTPERVEMRTFADLGGHTRCVAWRPQS